MLQLVLQSYWGSCNQDEMTKKIVESSDGDRYSVDAGDMQWIGAVEVEEE